MSWKHCERLIDLVVIELVIERSQAAKKQLPRHPRPNFLKTSRESCHSYGRINLFNSATNILPVRVTGGSSLIFILSFPVEKIGCGRTCEPVRRLQNK